FYLQDVPIFDVGAEEPKKELTEEKFLKDLFLFMTKRDTPIERIPHLGFKQIDLFLMFKTVNGLGGYQQVTAQQMWKQVYNALGGNPRSTSAATCTRRHYEKLLLPYECHLKGIILSVIPLPKPVHCLPYSKDDDCGPSQPKRRILHAYPVIALCMKCAKLFSFPFHPPLPSPPVLPPQSLPVLQPKFSIPPLHVSPTERVKEPLEHLRNLSNLYKTSSGLIQEPLNLSKKSSPPETISSPLSSFSPPSSSKNPKFLNKPSTLYTSHHTEVPRSDESETQKPEPRPGISSYSHPGGVRETDEAAKRDNDAPEIPQTPFSPKADCTLKPNEDGHNFNLQHLLSGFPRSSEGKMEIEVPLSVFQNWLKIYGTSAFYKTSPPPQEEHHGPTRWPDSKATPIDNPRHSPEDLRLRNTSPVPNRYTTRSPHSTNNNPLNRCSAWLSGGGSTTPNRKDGRPFDLQEANATASSRSPPSREESAPKKHEAGPIRAQPEFISKMGLEGKTQKSETQSSSLFKMDSNPLMMHFTTEEVMKLKKIISSSS
uniref:AT-rich interaction domain 6 n=1 Tax=Gouania willdenowi TaxID=441366 RepID=A0A8C5N6I7_GOUWI